MKRRHVWTSTKFAILFACCLLLIALSHPETWFENYEKANLEIGEEKANLEIGEEPPSPVITWTWQRIARISGVLGTVITLLAWLGVDGPRLREMLKGIRRGR